MKQHSKMKYHGALSNGFSPFRSLVGGPQEFTVLRLFKKLPTVSSPCRLVTKEQRLSVYILTVKITCCPQYCASLRQLISGRLVEGTASYMSLMDQGERVLSSALAWHLDRSLLKNTRTFHTLATTDATATIQGFSSHTPCLQRHLCQGTSIYRDCQKAWQIANEQHGIGSSSRSCKHRNAGEAERAGNCAQTTNRGFKKL